jgi:hypothetical protein
VLVALAACMGGTSAAQNPSPVQPGQQPTVPGRVSTPTTTGAAAPVAPAAPTTAVLARTFTAPVGLMFNTVRPERVADFERLLAEVQTALARSKNPATQALAKGWRFYKAAEAVSGGAVMFVFVVDPVVPEADYSLGKVLMEAYPDPVKLQEVWALYTGSVTGGGSLVNLTPVSATVKPAPAPAASPEAPVTPPATPPDAGVR